MQLQNINDIQLNASIREIKNKLEAIENKVTNIKETPIIDVSDINKKLHSIELEIKEFNNSNYNFVDTSLLLSEVNNNIKETNNSICKLNSDFSILNNTNLDINNAISKINKISTDFDKKTVLNQILINYPKNETASISSGHTILDFYNGIVTNSDGTLGSMSDAIENYAETYVRSFVIYADRKIDLNIIGKSSSIISLPAGTFRVAYGEITRLDIYVTSDTNIWVSGSLIPNGAPNISPSSVDSTTQPNNIITGSKTDISTTAAQLTTTSVLINKVVTIKVRFLAGAYVSIGDSSSQPYRLTSVGATHDVDYVDDLSKIYISAPIGTNSSVEWIGG